MKNLSFFLFIFFSFLVFSKKNSDEQTEKIKVTGSRIKRIDMEGTSPVTIFTKEDIENSGYSSVSAFFANTSLSNFGFIQIHNRSTLSLVNGQRIVRDRGVNFIPSSAIERIEILRDGASALYGSDVVGGVINIITKKNFSSPVLSLKVEPSFYPLYKGGHTIDASLVFGKNFQDGYFISTLQFQYAGSFKAIDRQQWYNPVLISYSPYPSFKQEGGDFFVDPKCPKKLQSKLQLEGSANERLVDCKHNYLPYSYISAGGYELSSYNYAEYKWLNDLRFYTQWLGVWSRSVKPDQPIIDDLKLPAGHKMSMGSGSAGTLKYLFTDVYYEKESSTFFLDALVGTKAYISKTWDFDWSLKLSNFWSRQKYKNSFYKEDIIKAIVSGVYDPFDSTKRDFSSVRRYDPLYKNEDMRIVTSLDFSGETDFWDIDLAIGFQAYYNRYKNTADSEVKKDKIYAFTAVERGLLTRGVIASYIEGIKKFSQLLEVQLAGRIDRYSDFGWTANPKLAFRFQPFSNFLIRSSVGTSFEAPSLGALNTPPTSTFVRVNDLVACYNELQANGHFEDLYSHLTQLKSQEDKDKIIKDFLIEQSDIVENKELTEATKKSFKKLANTLGNVQNCRSQSIKGIAQGNKDLKETKALTASLGFHWQVQEDHSLTVDAWFNSLSGVPASSLNSKVMAAELRYGKEYVEKQGVQYERDSEKLYNLIKNPVLKLINISGKKLSGIDMKWKSYFSDWSFKGGNFYFQDDFSYVIKAGVELFPGMGRINNLGKFSLPRWRNFATFGWSNSRHNISLVLKSVASVKKSYNEFDKLPIGNILDLFYQYYMDSRTALKLGWHNVLFLDPVIDDSIKQGLKFNSQFFELKGPHFFVELKRAL